MRNKVDYFYFPLQRTIHPSLTSRIQQLELRNRQLQAVLKQQQVYSESIMHRKWRRGIMASFCFIDLNLNPCRDVATATC